jgi:release factor glutamine methyltransferase
MPQTNAGGLKARHIGRRRHNGASRKQLTTLSTILVRATAQVAASPDLCDTAARDALTLLLHTLGITRAEFYANPDREITLEKQAAYEAATARRLKNEPIQYITGEQEFYGLTLRVTPAVLIPRPETEHLVEAVLAELTAPQNDLGCHSAASSSETKTERRNLLFRDAPLRILDIGTGSGAIAIALVHHLPHAHITATDISPTALAIARENAARHDVRIDFMQSDLLDHLNPVIRSEGASTTNLSSRAEARSAGVEGPAGASLTAKTFDAIVCNPPYVPESDRASLHPQVRDYEPAAALFAGDNGLAIYRRLIPQAHASLVPNGLLALEIGHGQRDALAALLSGWNSVRFVDDLQGIPRVALARKASS